jgi:hypothetical protein
MPDMAMSTANCNNCTTVCALMCVGNMCCLENFVLGTCTPDPACFP